jgi:hypothetical protein
LAALLERPCRVYARVFTLDDYTEELEALAESVLGVACRHAREDGGAGFPGALVPRPCEELERYRGGGAAEPVPRGETLSLVRALAHEACQFRAFRASLDGGQRASGEADNIVRRAVTAMAQIQVEQGLTSLSVDPDDNRGAFRFLSGTTEGASGGGGGVGPASPAEFLPSRAQAGELRSVPLRETFAGLIKGAEQLSDAEVEAAVQGLELRALIALYEGLEGAGWARRGGGAEALAPGAEKPRGGVYCGWHGVECQGQASGVRRLVLPDNNLRGRLPGTVGGLRHLQVLDLARNALKGPAPADIALLAQLRAFDVQGNLLHGALPAAFADLQEVRLFDVSANRLEAPLPQLVKARHLALFNVSENAGLAGEFPRWLLEAGALEALSMSGAGVRGELPRGLVALPQLRLLDLSRNELEGRIPPEILAHTSLQVLDLSQNRLEGDLREAFPDPRESPPLRAAASTSEGLQQSGEGEEELEGAGQGTAKESSDSKKAPGVELVVCSLASNQLSGSLPAKLPPGLMMLDVADNRLTSYHPDAVLQLGQLRYLNLSQNALEGPLLGTPHGLSRLRRLQSLDASRNRLSGGLPEDVGLLPDLQVLRLDGNVLSGPLPDGLSRLARLQVLTLGNNALSGALPPDLHRLQSLRVLDLANNSLSGPAPYQLVGGRLLERADLSGNALSWSP